MQSTLPGRLLRRRRRVGPEEHHLGRRARPRGRDLDPQPLLGRRPVSIRPPQGMNLVSQKMGISEWSYHNDYNPSPRQKMQHVELTKRFRASDLEVELGFIRRADRARGAALPQLRRGDGLQRAALHRVRRLHRHLPGPVPDDHQNGDEADLRTRLSAPATNLDQDLYVSAPLPQTGRVMVKDEERLRPLRTVRRALPDGRLGHGAVRAPRSPTPRARTSSGSARGDLTRAEQRDRRSARSATQVNDFAIKLANVNGTGSASANSLLMQAIFRMGDPGLGQEPLPVEHPGPAHLVRDPRQQGRATPRARCDYDLMVAMNSQTYAQDIADVRHGGYVIYDSSWPLDRDLTREDVTFLGVPLAKMCLENFKEPRERILMKNIAYAGASWRWSASTWSVVGRPARRDSSPRNERAARLEPAGPPARLRLRDGALRLPAAVPRRADGRQRQADPDRRQHCRRPSAASTPAPPSPAGTRSPRRRRSWTTSSNCALVPRETVVSDDPNVPDDAQQLPDHPGRGRDRRDRHGARRGWSGARAFTSTSGPGHLADERAARPGATTPRSRPSSSTCSASARRPACRRARSRPTS